MADLTLWAYPWDVVDEGIDACLNRMKNELGITRVSVTALYHSGKFLLPRNPRRRVYFPEPGACYFPPSDEHYRDLVIQPISSTLAEDDTYGRIRESAAEHGLEFEAWVLGFHNTGVGSRHIEACIENAYGDRYPFALCPANPDAQDFVHAVLTDVVEHYKPETLFLETHNYLNYGHGFHHEFTPAPSTDVDKYLLSLCFCSHCSDIFEESGIDAESTRAWITEFLDGRLNRYHDPDVWEGQDFDGLLALIDSRQDLQDVTDARKGVVTELTRTYADACHSRNSKFGIVAGLFARPSSRVWMEGSDLVAQSEIADEISVLAYHAEAADVEEDARHALSTIDLEKLRLALMVSLPDATSPKNLEEKVNAALGLGIRNFGFYNYGFMNEPRMRWLSDATQIIQAAR